MNAKIGFQEYAIKLRNVGFAEAPELFMRKERKCKLSFKLWQFCKYFPEPSQPSSYLYALIFLD
jgi:hypothetical protein